MVRERAWSYKNFKIVEGLKPKSEHFQYFYVVSERGERKCNYCVWIDDDILSRFGRSEDFEEIPASRREEWSQWVREKIDQEDFRNLVLSLEQGERKEIDLRELEEKLSSK